MEGYPEGEVSLNLSVDRPGQTRPARLYRLLPISELVHPRATCLGATGWSDCDGVDRNETGVEVWWEGEQYTGSRMESEPDEALNEQLRALGYLD
jgi:hypothetical protein